MARALLFLGRLALGLLILAAGAKLFVNEQAFQTQLKSYQQLQTLAFDQGNDKPMSKDHMTVLVYIEAVLQILGGTLMIAHVNLGGLLVAAAVLVNVVTIDNPYLTTSSVGLDLALSNLFKDLAVIAAALMLSLRSRQVQHRKKSKKVD